MAQKPSVPQAVPNAKESPATPTWLFLFYQWVVEKIDTFTSIFSTTDFVVGTASSELGAERVATDTASIDVDIGTSGQIKWSVIDEYVQDLVGALVVDSAELDFTYTDATPDLTAVLKTTGVTAAAYGSASAVATFTVDSKGRLTTAATTSILITSAQVSDFTEAAQDAVGGTLTDTTSIDFTYDDAAGTITADVKDEYVQDTVGAMLTDSSTVDFTYTDAAGTLTAAVIPGGIDHGALADLTADDHTQYVLLAGRSGGQVVIGGTGAGDDLTLRSTSDATKGDLLALDTGGNLILGGAATASELRFMEPSGSGTNYSAFKAQAQAANVTYTLPAADGSANQVLSTNGSGTLSWATAGSGSDAAPMTPQGRLTLTTGVPVMASEAAAQTTIYYTPYVGSIVPLYDGSNWTNTQFSELSIAMAASANWATDKNFDLFVCNDAGTLRLVTGAAWTNDTTRAEALVRTNGIWLNNASFTGRYGASSTVSLDASRATYVGTMRCSANGTTTWELGGSAANGDEIKLFLWNCYNRSRVAAQCNDTTDTWTWATASWRNANGSATNRATWILGLTEDVVDVVNQRVAFMVTGGLDNPSIALALDSSSTPTGQFTQHPSTNLYGFIGISRLASAALGAHYAQCIERVASAADTAIFVGDAGGTHSHGLQLTGMF